MTDVIGRPPCHNEAINDTKEISKNKRERPRQMKLQAALSREILKCQKGQSLIETALILPIVFLISFGMIDLSRLAYASTVVQAATEAGTRAGIIDRSDIASAVESHMVGLDASQASIVVVPSSVDIVQVEVRYQFQFLTPIHGAVELRGNASMFIR
ncbi:MAG: pilus assembly protein [Caldilineaceae bacterium]|nr:pilus assembly protein [Caldilineaceae bacterium]